MTGRQDVFDNPVVYGPPWGAVAVAAVPVVAALGCAFGPLPLRFLGWLLAVVALFASLYAKRADVRLAGPRYVGAATMRKVIPLIVASSVAMLVLNGALVAWNIARR